MPLTFETLLKKADSDHDPACFLEITEAYLHGRGVTKDVDKALEYFLSIINLGESESILYGTRVFAEYCAKADDLSEREKIIEFIADPEKVSVENEKAVIIFEETLLTFHPSLESERGKQESGAASFSSGMISKEKNDWKVELASKEMAEKRKKYQTIVKKRRADNLKLYQAKQHYDDSLKNYQHALKEKKEDEIQFKKNELALAKFDWRILKERNQELKKIGFYKTVTTKSPKPDSLFEVRLFRGGRARKERELIAEQVNALYASANAPIRMRNIMVKQEGKGYGEFDMPYKKETSSKLVERLFQQISDATHIACNIHLENNFYPLPEDPETGMPLLDTQLMKDECLNEMTRLCFPEFSFYPCKQHGPLMKAEFDTLLREIETLAKKSPQNLHLVLGTFPVINDKKDVSNIAVYVQCGSKSKISLIPKVISSLDDLYYPRTRLPFFKEGSESHMFREEIKTEGGALLSSLLSDSKLVTVESIESFTQLCLCNTDYPPPIELIEQLQELKNYVISNNLNEQKANDFYKKISSYLGTALFDGVKSHSSFFHQISEKRSRFYLEPMVNDHLDLLEHPAKKTVDEVTRHISCRTAGGAEFSVAIEICMEHGFAIALKTKQKRMNDQLHLGIFSPTVSHIVVSNWTNLRKQSMLSQLTEHIDSREKFKLLENRKDGKTEFKEIKIDAMRKMDSVFGSPALLEIYEPTHLQPMSGDIQQSIELNHLFMRDYLMLKTLRDRYPPLCEAYNNAILFHIIHTCFDVLSKMITYNPKILSDPFLQAARDNLEKFEIKFQSQQRSEKTALAELNIQIQSCYKINPLAVSSLLQLTGNLLSAECAEQSEQKAANLSTQESRCMDFRWR